MGAPAKGGPPPADVPGVAPRLVCLFVAAAAGLGPLLPAVVAAETRQQRKERQAAVAAQLRTLREEVSEASGEEAELLDRLDEVRAERRRLDGRVRSLDRQLQGVSQMAEAAEARLERMQGDFVRAQTGLVTATERLAVERGVLRDRAVSAYMGGRPPATAAEVILRARSLREVAAGVGYEDAVVHARRRAVRSYSARRDATARLRLALEAKKDAAKAQRDVVVSRQGELEAVRSAQDAARQEVLAQEARQSALVGEARARLAEFEAQIAALRVESGTVREFLRELQAGRQRHTGGAGTLAPPVPGSRLTSGFGPRRHPVLGTARMHDGADYAAPSGAPVRAAAAGTVVFAGPRGGYGNTVVIDHGTSLATLYAHQSALYVAEGAAVAAGQVIGAVGSTGLSTGPHLHFETRVQGAPVDPLPYL